jgi:hypothetical protein
MLRNEVMVPCRRGARRSRTGPARAIPAVPVRLLPGARRAGRLVTPGTLPAGYRPSRHTSMDLSETARPPWSQQEIRDLVVRLAQGTPPRDTAGR